MINFRQAKKLSQIEPSISMINQTSRKDLIKITEKWLQGSSKTSEVNKSDLEIIFMLTHDLNQSCVVNPVYNLGWNVCRWFKKMTNYFLLDCLFFLASKKWRKTVVILHTQLEIKSFYLYSILLVFLSVVEVSILRRQHVLCGSRKYEKIK